MAWVDGTVDVREVEVIAALLERAGVPVVERLAMMDRELSHPPSDARFPAELDDPAARRSALQNLVQLCFADGQTHPEELRLIGDLALSWGVSADELDSMRRQALESL